MLTMNVKTVAIGAFFLIFTACGGETEQQTKVFKHDGSLQCGKAGISLDEMRLDLAKTGIDVICTQKGHDGYTRVALCETETGSINVFVIHNSNLPDAEKLGFKSVKELPEYKDQQCNN